MVRTIRVVIELAEGGPTARVVVAVDVLVHHPTPQSRFLNRLRAPYAFHCAEEQ